MIRFVVALISIIIGLIIIVPIYNEKVDKQFVNACIKAGGNASISSGKYGTARKCFDSRGKLITINL